MPVECNPATLITGVSCFACLSPDQQQLAKLGLLCAIADGDVVACNPQALIDRAKCFACVPSGTWPLLEIALLCEIAQGGGGGTVNCDPIAARAVDDTGTQKATNGAIYYAVNWNKEDFDTDNMIDLGANPNIITIQEDGIYLVTAGIIWQTTEDAAPTNVQMVVLKNGVIPTAAGSTFIGTDQQPFDNTATVVTGFTTAVQLQAGDYLWVGLNQNSGQDLSIGGGGTDFNFLSASKIVGCQASA